MNKLLWFARMLFSPKSKLNEKDNIDWHWWLYTELPYWWYTRPIYQAFQQCVQWTRATLRRNEEPSDDDIPF